MSEPDGVLLQAAPRRGTSAALRWRRPPVLRVADIRGERHRDRSTEGSELDLQRPHSEGARAHETRWLPVPTRKLQTPPQVDFPEPSHALQMPVARFQHRLTASRFMPTCIITPFTTHQANINRRKLKDS